MKHFLNRDMLAPNVMTVPVDPAIVDEFAPLCAGWADQAGYFVARPPWHSDVSWLSADTPETFERFESAFRRLDVARRFEPYLDLEREVRLYNGFIIIRTSCSDADFHVDWKAANNEAFTLITPLSSNAADHGLLYKTLTDETAEYRYARGEAIVFGDKFVHSTKPGRSTDPVFLLCFQFGTDRMEHWDKIVVTAGTQSRLIRQPDGNLVLL